VSWLQFAGQVIGKSSAIDRLCGNLQLDITKARSMLNWKPPVTFKEGVKRAMLTTGQVSKHAK
jgi:nucleoside-diphosphate-sugar epimerase